VRDEPADAASRPRAERTSITAEDPDAIISFGLFDGTLEGPRQAQARLGRQSQVDRIGPHVQDAPLDGSYEIAKQRSAGAGADARR
jgi:hypothetical protein